MLGARWAHGLRRIRVRQIPALRRNHQYRGGLKTKRKDVATETKKQSRVAGAIRASFSAIGGVGSLAGTVFLFYGIHYYLDSEQVTYDLLKEPLVLGRFLAAYEYIFPHLQCREAAIARRAQDETDLRTRTKEAGFSEIGDEDEPIMERVARHRKMYEMQSSGRSGGHGLVDDPFANDYMSDSKTNESVKLINASTSGDEVMSTGVATEAVRARSSACDEGSTTTKQQEGGHVSGRGDGAAGGDSGDSNGAGDDTDVVCAPRGEAGSEGEDNAQSPLDKALVTAAAMVATAVPFAKSAAARVTAATETAMDAVFSSKAAKSTSAPPVTTLTDSAPPPPLLPPSKPVPPPTDPSSSPKASPEEATAVAQDNAQDKNGGEAVHGASTSAWAAVEVVGGDAQVIDVAQPPPPAEPTCEHPQCEDLPVGPAPAGDESLGQSEADTAAHVRTGDTRAAPMAPTSASALGESEDAPPPTSTLTLAPVPVPVPVPAPSDASESAGSGQACERVANDDVAVTVPSDDVAVTVPSDDAGEAEAEAEACAPHNTHATEAAAVQTTPVGADEDDGTRGGESQNYIAFAQHQQLVALAWDQVAILEIELQRSLDAADEKHNADKEALTEALTSKLREEARAQQEVILMEYKAGETERAEKLNQMLEQKLRRELHRIEQTCANKLKDATVVGDAKRNKEVFEMVQNLDELHKRDTRFQVQEARAQAEKEASQRHRHLLETERDQRLQVAKEISISVKALEHILNEQSTREGNSRSVHALVIAAHELATSVRQGRSLTKDISVLRNLEIPFVDASLDALEGSVGNAVVGQGLASDMYLNKTFHELKEKAHQVAKVQNEDSLYANIVSYLAWQLAWKTPYTGANVEGHDTHAALGRAEHLLRTERDLDDVLAEVDSLTGASRAVFAEWMDRSRAKIVGEQLSAAIHAHAMCAAINSNDTA